MSLWNGPKILKQADYVCYGHPSPPATAVAEREIAEDNPESRITDSEEAIIEPEFVDDESGELPLLPSNGGSSNNASE